MLGIRQVLFYFTMNRIKVLIIALLVTMGAISTNAQYKSNAIKFNAFGVFAGQYQLGYEMALDENISLQLSTGYIRRSATVSTDLNSNIDEGSLTTNGIIIIPEARYYFDEALTRFYLGAFIRYRNVKRTLNDPSPTVSYTVTTDNWSSYRRKTAIGGGIIAGYQILINDGFIVDIFAGIQYKSIHFSTRKFDDPAVSTDAEVPSFDIFNTIFGNDRGGLSVRIGLNLGYSF